MSIAEPLAELDVAAETLADVLKGLGGIPANRILMTPAPGTATPADVVTAAENAPRRFCEVIDGVLVERAMGIRESFLAAAILTLLRNHVTAHNLGLVAGADGTIHLSAGRMRIPDVAFFSWDRLPGRRMPKKPVANVAPDLAIEVISQGNTLTEVKRKRREYFGFGVRVVWQFDPRGRTVAVYTKPEGPKILRGDQVLTGGDVLPGFRVSLPEVFAELDRQG